MPPLVLHKVAEHLEQYDRIAFASTCKAFREAIEAALNHEGRRKKLVTSLWFKTLQAKSPRFSLGWFKWAHGSFDRREGVAPGRVGVPTHQLFDSDLMELASCQGSVEALRWLRSQGIPLDRDSYRAAMGGHTSLLEYLRSEGEDFGMDTCHSAAFGGQLDTLKWLRGLDPPCPWDAKTCLAAAWGGHVEVLKWLKQEGCPWPEFAAQQAASFGRIEVLEWLRSEGKSFCARTCSAAALGGHLGTLRWLRGLDPPCPWDASVVESAIEGGHLQVLKWLRQEGCPWYIDAVPKAACCGRIEILRWLMSERPALDERACEAAAMGGRLRTLVWLRSQDPPYPWNKSECRSLAQRYFNHSHIVRWIDQQPNE